MTVLYCHILGAQGTDLTPDPTERLSGQVKYYEEITYNVWNLRLSSGQTGEATIQTIKRPQSITCHEFDAQGHETVITGYVQRNANVGSIGMDSLGNIDFIANDISRATPDTRTVMHYDDQGRLGMKKIWSFNIEDCALVLADSCVYDSAGTLCNIIMTRDSIPLPNIYQKQDRNGSYSITFNDGTSESYRYDSERYLVRYKDRDNKVIRFFYNERGLITRQISEWENGSVLNVVFTDYEFDEFGNWIRCIRQVKDPGEPPRSTKIIERTYSYR